MSDVALLERAIGKVSSKDRSIRDRLDGLKKNLAASPESLHEIVTEFWRLLFWPVHDVGAAELNILEKMLSYGMINSTSTLESDIPEDSTAREIVYLLPESLKLAARLAVKPELELEAIKICLTTATTLKCTIEWKDVQLALETLMQTIARTRNLVNKSAAKGALTQIVYDQLSSADSTVGTNNY